MSENVLLRAEQLSVHFGGVRALEAVDFSLRAGELRCLIGPNGAGKTTFFRCLTGRQRPTKGAITFRGSEIAGNESFEIARRGIGIKTQVPSLFDGLSVRENVWLALRRIADRKGRSAEVQRSLERFQIGSLAERSPNQLAHGQRQLVELAMVVAGNPELILLDEPAAGMTGDEVNRLAAIIAEVNQSHSLIVVEHDMQFIRMIASTVTVFHQGRILVEGDVQEILRDQRVRDVYLGHSHER
jgi:ABC-type uncharacterized transport system ATPase subunit